jgi:superfamily II DNA helicase RecQ
LGNRTLLEISRSHAADLDTLAEIKGVTDLILKRLGKDLVAAVKKGLRKPHGPIPKLETTGRRRMDKRTEKRLAALKDWRGPRAEALKLDPGVLCPNAALESIAAANPENAEDMKALTELKSWFVREFSSEIIGVLERHASEGESSEPTKADGDAGAGDDKENRPKRTRRRSGGDRAASAKTTSSSRSGARTKSEK